MSELPSMDRSRVKKSTLQSQGSDEFVADATPAERISMVWPLTLEAWTFKDPNVAESRFQRHVVRVIRGRR